ncbi:hypothetical protein HDK77DRAFT_487484 [Phyllosticta capitalensis]
MSEQSSPPQIAMDAPSSNPCASERAFTAWTAIFNPPAICDPSTANPAPVTINTNHDSVENLNAPQPAVITPPKTHSGTSKIKKAKPDLAAEANAILAEYDSILLRIEQENADILASARRLAASRKNMTRAFDDVAKLRQRMSTIFEKARAASTAAHPSPSPTPNSPYGGGTGNANADNNPAARPARHTHKRTPSELAALDLERRRWDVMTRYEALCRERKAADAEVAKMEEKRGKDAEWIHGMFFRVAEKGLFEAAVVREKKRTPVVLDDEGEVDDGCEGEEVEY